MMSGVPLETCWAFNKLWNNKFYYKLRLVAISTELYDDARIHEYQNCIINVYMGGGKSPLNLFNLMGKTPQAPTE